MRIKTLLLWNLHRVAFGALLAVGLLLPVLSGFTSSSSARSGFQCGSSATGLRGGHRPVGRQPLHQCRRRAAHLSVVVRFPPRLQRRLAEQSDGAGRHLFRRSARRLRRAVGRQRRHNRLQQPGDDFDRGHAAHRRCRSQPGGSRRRRRPSERQRLQRCRRRSSQLSVEPGFAPGRQSDLHLRPGCGRSDLRRRPGRHLRRAVGGLRHARQQLQRHRQHQHSGSAAPGQRRPGSAGSHRQHRPAQRRCLLRSRRRSSVLFLELAVGARRQRRRAQLGHGGEPDLRRRPGRNLRRATGGQRHPRQLVAGHRRSRHRQHSPAGQCGSAADRRPGRERSAERRRIHRRRRRPAHLQLDPAGQARRQFGGAA